MEKKLKYFSEEKKKYEEIMALTPEKSGLSRNMRFCRRKAISNIQYQGFLGLYVQPMYVMTTISLGVNEQSCYQQDMKDFWRHVAKNRLIGLMLCVLVAVYSASAVLGMSIV